MMMSASVFDVTREQGAVGILHDLGVDPWVVDFGARTSNAVASRTFSDHVAALSRVGRLGTRMHRSRCASGGLLARRNVLLRNRGLPAFRPGQRHHPGQRRRSLSGLPFRIPAALAGAGAQFIADHVFNHLSVSGWMARTGFQLLDPIE